MTFVTLDTITEDLLKIVRASKINDSEPISKRQLEDWVHQYRAVLIAQDIDKKRYANPDYIQEISFLELEQVRVDGGGVTPADGFPYTFDFPLAGITREIGTEYLLRTKLELPKTLDFNFKSGITWIGDTTDIEYNLIPQNRHNWQQYKRYSSNEIVSFLRNKRLFFTNNNPDLDYITVRGIFEIPTEVMRFVNPVTDQGEADLSTPYPIPNNMIPTLKEMILSKELKIEASAPSDVKNDNSFGVSPNQE